MTNFLKSFNTNSIYRLKLCRALLLSLSKKNMMIYLSLVDEFIQRGCLERTVKSLTSEELSELVGYVLPLIHKEKYCKLSILLL